MTLRDSYVTLHAARGGHRPVTALLCTPGANRHSKHDDGPLPGTKVLPSARCSNGAGAVGGYAEALHVLVTVFKELDQTVCGAFFKQYTLDLLKQRAVAACAPFTARPGISATRPRPADISPTDSASGSQTGEPAGPGHTGAQRLSLLPPGAAPRVSVPYLFHFPRAAAGPTLEKDPWASFVPGLPQKN